jgi:hypothetical protein
MLDRVILLCVQEDEELEVELVGQLGIALESSTPQHPLERALQLLEKHDAASAAKLLENHMGAGTNRRRQLTTVASPHATMTPAVEQQETLKQLQEQQQEQQPADRDSHEDE